MDNMKDYELSRDLQNTKLIKKPFSSTDAENILLENVIKGMYLYIIDEFYFNFSIKVLYRIKKYIYRISLYIEKSFTEYFPS